MARKKPAPQRPSFRLRIGDKTPHTLSLEACADALRAASALVKAVAKEQGRPTPKLSMSNIAAGSAVLRMTYEAEDAELFSAVLAASKTPGNHNQEVQDAVAGVVALGANVRLSLSQHPKAGDWVPVQAPTEEAWCEHVEEHFGRVVGMSISDRRKVTIKTERDERFTFDVTDNEVWRRVKEFFDETDVLRVRAVFRSFTSRRRMPLTVDELEVASSELTGADLLEWLGASRAETRRQGLTFDKDAIS